MNDSYRPAADERPAILPCARPAPAAADRSRGSLLSLVIPCHNEEAVIDTTHARLIAVLPSTLMDFEIIYVDDGSDDATLARLESIVARDPRVRVIELARNFGQQAAMSAGLAAARGDAVVITDADLQDPPEVIPEMVRAWRSGVDVAYGRRRSRAGETWFKRITARSFYRLFASLIPYPVPVDTGDFKLIDRAVANAVASLPEKRRYLRSLVPWTGFRHEAVWYDRHARVAGTTNYSPWKLLKLAGDAMVLSSDAPVRLTWVAAIALALLAIGSAGVAVLSQWSEGPSQPGISFAAMTAIVALVGALQTAAVAIVGEYVVRTYREAQGRPPYVVRRTLSSSAAARSQSDGPSSQAA